jgi:hypothetical protein
MAEEETTATPAEWIDLLARNAQRLRDAGVLRLRLEGAEVEFAPAFPAAVQQAAPEPAAIVDALHDPVTYARHGGYIPGFQDPGQGDRDG